jgi:hypothetical protein
MPATLENRAGEVNLIAEYGGCNKNYSKIGIISRKSMRLNPYVLRM